eukprot:scaffold6015_cov278-Chaetoceros_neogracile.AAC.3
MLKRTDDFEMIELEDKSTVAFHAGCVSSSTFWGIVVLGVERQMVTFDLVTRHLHQISIIGHTPQSIYT